MKLTTNEICEIITKMNVFKLTDIINVSPFKSVEDGSDYNVWLLETINEKYVLKKAKSCEYEIYSTFLNDGISGAPKLIESTQYEKEKYILLEYVEGKDLCKCDRHSLELTLDALIYIQDKFWNDTIYLLR